MKNNRKPVIAVRVPAPLHQRIKDSALASGRSMSEEMAWRLDRSFDEVRIIDLVREAIRAPDAPPELYGPPAPQLSERAFCLRHDGHTYASIAKTLGVSRERATHLVKHCQRKIEVRMNRLENYRG